MEKKTRTENNFFFFIFLPLLLFILFINVEYILKKNQEKYEEICFQLK